MEGERTDRKVGFSRNRPLSDFLQALPQMAIHPINQAITDRVNILQDEIRRVEFQPPADFDTISYFIQLASPVIGLISSSNRLDVYWSSHHF